MKAVDIYTDMGRFSIAAKHHQTIAEIYEGDAADLERAMQHYEQAADFFRVCMLFYDKKVQFLSLIFSFQGEESKSAANKCMLNVAKYSAQLENYERAIQIYEQVRS